jgi:hypothetical protein
MICDLWLGRRGKRGREQKEESIRSFKLLVAARIISESTPVISLKDIINQKSSSASVQVQALFVLQFKSNTTLCHLFSKASNSRVNPLSCFLKREACIDITTARQNNLYCIPLIFTLNIFVTCRAEGWRNRGQSRFHLHLMWSASGACSELIPESFSFNREITKSRLLFQSSLDVHARQMENSSEKRNACQWPERLKKKWDSDGRKRFIVSPLENAEGCHLTGAPHSLILQNIKYNGDRGNDFDWMNQNALLCFRAGANE